MRLLIIRHGDPNYEIDNLTERGVMEAELLAKRMARTRIDHVYVSPLGRAQATARIGLKETGLFEKAVTYDWLREFEGKSVDGNTGEKVMCWDYMPGDWTGEPSLFDRREWLNAERMQKGTAPAEYRWVIGEFDALLARHGYVRDGDVYRAERPNDETIAFFCHFGLECVLLSHLIGVSPVVLWQGTIFAPTSVSVIYTEEREEGTAIFRAAALGDTSHLYVSDVDSAFAGRFCEQYTNTWERH